MSRANEDALTGLVTVWLVFQVLSGLTARQIATPGRASLPPATPPRATPPRATRTPPRATKPKFTNGWSEVTMRVFVDRMRAAGIDPGVVLLGIAAASNFDPTEYLGSNTGLLLVQRSDLVDVGYPGVPTFEESSAVHQIPWIGKVIGYRISSAGGKAPTTVPDLAVLLHPANPTITGVIRAEAERRSKEAERSEIYKFHADLLRRVLSNP